LPTFKKSIQKFRSYTSESDLLFLFSFKGFSVYSKDLLLPFAALSENDLNADLGGLDFGGAGISGS
jgi:hypothetical protein